MQLTAAGFQRLMEIQKQYYVSESYNALDLPLENTETQLDLMDCERKSITVQTKNSLLYNGILGSISIQSKKKFIAPEGPLGEAEDLISEEKSILMLPSFLRNGLSISFMGSVFSIPKSLNVFHILSDDAEIFSLADYGDLEALQLAFQNGAASPFVSDQTGATLLYVGPL